MAEDGKRAEGRDKNRFVVSGHRAHDRLAMEHRPNLGEGRIVDRETLLLQKYINLPEQLTIPLDASPRLSRAN